MIFDSPFSKFCSVRVKIPSFEEIGIFKNIFKKWDKNGDGTVTMKEIFEYYKSFSKIPMDGKNDGIDVKIMDFAKFSDFMETILSYSKKKGLLIHYKRWFNEFDYEYEGNINKDGLEHILRENRNFSDIDMEKFLDSFDGDANGKFDLHEVLVCNYELLLAEALMKQLTEKLPFNIG